MSMMSDRITSRLDFWESEIEIPAFLLGEIVKFRIPPPELGQPIWFQGMIGIIVESPGLNSVVVLCENGKIIDVGRVWLKRP